LAPDKQVGLDALFTLDMTLGWNIKPIKRWENVSFEPQMLCTTGSTADSPRLPMSGTTRSDRMNRMGLGSGVFAIGAPRWVESGFRPYF